MNMHPFILVSSAIAIAGLIYAANRLNPWLTAVIFGVSVLGAVITAIRAARNGTMRRPKIDYARLNQTNLLVRARWLKDNVRGHDTVINDIVASLQEELVLARKGRILGAYLLVGPTGTGKTFLSQLIAEALYPKSEPIILRMNQLKHADDVFTLIGPPPGRPGYEIGGALTRPVLENPYRVVIFDEIEKCHPDIRHCLYDILDAGQCREKSSGKIVDFSGCSFFATCNAGTERLRAIREKGSDSTRTAMESRDALVEAAGFDKAFLSRWTRIELMDELPPVQVAEVALLQLCKYWRDYDIQLSYVEPRILLDAVERNDEFRQYGVRQLSHYIRTKANHAIQQARGANMKSVMLDVKDGQIIAKKEI